MKNNYPTIEDMLNHLTNTPFMNFPTYMILQFIRKDEYNNNLMLNAIDKKERVQLVRDIYDDLFCAAEYLSQKENLATKIDFEAIAYMFSIKK